ncbi:MAG TPA: hypothetical protein VIG38_09285 [Hyphomicrobium sp.]|jgi:hypothetical protein
MRAFRALMAVLLFLCLLPMMSMAVAEFIAQLYGCKLDLASVHPCIVGGRDIGQDLLTLGMMGYFLFVTMPGVVAVIAVWIIVELIAWMRRRSLAAG